MDYSELKVSELEEKLRERGLNVSGKKGELVSRLLSADKHSQRDRDEAPEEEPQAKRPRIEQSVISTSGKTSSGEEALEQQRYANASDQGSSHNTNSKENKSATESNEPTKIDEKSKHKLEADDDRPQAPESDEAGNHSETKNSRLEASSSDSKEEPREADHGGILERGHCYFFYRPKVNMSSEEVSGIEDIAKFEIIFKPADSKIFRHMNIGRKQLPHAEGGHRPFWAAITAVAEELDQISDGLQSKHYETKTQGERTQPAARPAGRGSYVVHVEGEKSKRATHLAYVLSDPAEPGEVQRDLSIFKEGAFVIQVKDPHSDGPTGASLSADRRAHYPEKLQSLFRTKYRLAEPIDLLNYAGTELLLIAAKSDVEDKLGSEEQQHLEQEANQETRANKDIYKELHLNASEHPAEALKGEWV